MGTNDSSQPPRGPALPQPPVRRPASHVQAALGATAQPRKPLPGPATARVAAPHIQQALGRAPVTRPAITPPITPPILQARPAAARLQPPPLPPARPVPPAGRLPQVAQCLEVDEAFKGLGSTEQGLLSDWLDARSPGKGPGKNDTDDIARGLLLSPVPSIPALEEILTLFKNNRNAASSHDSSYEDKVVDDLYDHLTKSKLLIKAGKSLSLFEVKGSLVFLDDPGFEKAHYAEQLSINPNYDPKHKTYLGGSKEWDFKIIHARKIDQTLAFEHGGKIHLRQGAADMHIAIHELVHKLSAIDNSHLGRCLCEGLTERIALAICNERSVALSGSFYTKERVLVESFAKLYKFSEDDLMDFYFTDPAPFVKRLKADLGDSGFSAFKQEKVPAQAQKTFLDEREKESQKKVTAGIYYEISPKTYGIIPAAVGQSGKTLKSHVEKAIEDYPFRLFGIGQSNETSAALTVLGGILNDFPKLYVAVLWYLKRLTTKPKTVALGTALKAGSKFDTLLKNELALWEV